MRDFSFLPETRTPIRTVPGKDRFDESWPTNNSTIMDYSSRAQILGRSNGLIEVLRDRLEPLEQRAGLDIAAGSYAIALRDLLRMRLIDRGLATNFDDMFDDEQDGEGGLISHVDGDLREEQTWHKIHDWVDVNAVNGLAVVLHRPMGGLRRLETETYAGAAHHILDMIRPGGLFFTQVPETLEERPDSLIEICESIVEREDVEAVLPSHDALMHAVILKAA